MDLARPVDLAFWQDLGVQPHPVCPLPDEAWLREHTEDELVTYLLDRDEVIHAMAEDPLNRGHEPPVWRILDALLGFPWMETAEPADWWKDAPLTCREWSLMVRRKLLRQDDPIKVLLLNGGNRAGKSEWAASRVIRILLRKAGARAWCFHQDEDMSKQYQQPLLYKYFPPELRTDRGFKQGKPTYIAYKTQTGFADGHFVLPNASDCDFRYYQQDVKKIQGGELDIVWCDELVPASWVKELKARVATRRGWVIITFTPIEGYTTTVKMFLDVAKPTVESTAFVLPKDGGASRKDLALVGEDSYAWLRADTAGNEIIMAGQPAIPDGRTFDKVPRVMCCPPQRGEEHTRSGVFFLHSFDNPFGGAEELFAMYSGDTAGAQKMRFYGVATKAVAGKFPKFSAVVHVVKPSAVPPVGTNYMVCDPCSGRNFAMAWARVDRAAVGKRYWIYREWPCPGKYVSGIGDMGNWAEPGDKHDGERGPAQDSLGWGLERYKQEIARVEGHSDWEAPVKEKVPTKFDADDTEDYVPVRRRRPRPEDGEDVYERIMDSRYGNTPTPTREGMTTLIEEFAKLGLDFVPASGSSATEDGMNWIHLINDMLDYDDKKPVGPLNSPRIFVSEECQNIIFALQNWTNEDGLHGACKDFVDLVKYLVLHDCEDWSDSERRRGRQKEEAA